MRATIHRASRCAPFLAAVLGASSCKLSIVSPSEPPPETWDPALNTHPAGAALQAVLDRYVQAGLPGAVLLVRTPEGQWNGAAGYATIETAIPMLPTHRHHAASVTKMYMAAAVLLLVQDGAIQLDTTISAYLPAAVYQRIPNGAEATVRQLLGHRSGIPDFDGALAYDLDFLNDPLGSYPPERLLGYLRGQSAIFAPGTGYFYSNANYLLLALIVDHVTGSSHADVISERILAPLALSTTYYRSEAGYPDVPGLVSSYEDLAGDGRLMNVSDLVAHNAHVFMGNAGMIATSADYATFLEALLGGRLVNAGLLAEMQAWGERSRYGLGLDFVETPHGPAIGHSGGDVGVLCQVRAFPDRDATLVLLVNGGDSGTTATLFGRLWDEIMEVALREP